MCVSEAEHCSLILFPPNWLVPQFSDDSYKMTAEWAVSFGVGGCWAKTKLLTKKRHPHCEYESCRGSAFLHLRMLCWTSFLLIENTWFWSSYWLRPCFYWLNDSALTITVTCFFWWNASPIICNILSLSLHANRLFLSVNLFYAYKEACQIQCGQI